MQNKHFHTILWSAMLTASLLTTATASAQDDMQENLWGDIDHKGKPWVTNVSKPYEISRGLFGRHLSLWASHGRYYDVEKDRWKWQRPLLFGTTEDIFTPTIVSTYLMPMLENAGAIVFSPRERDFQTNEIIIDNDDKIKGTRFIAINGHYEWQTAPTEGFRQPTTPLADGQNPFKTGTTLMCRTTKKRKSYSLLSYQPHFPQAGRYAVYVSYQTVEGSTDEASYTVYHKGERTEIKVNQQMGGGTWVYIGTYDFDSGSNEYNRVEVTNRSSKKRSVVTSDAIRFGGGMGNIRRGDDVSNMPRCMEAARYYAQWAGMPYSVYGGRNGNDDYSDDINTRSLMTNYLAGGSCFVPSKKGLKVPIELSLAVHSDAGVTRDGVSLIGSLGICTTSFNDGRLNSGVSRLMSKSLAQMLTDGVTKDMKAKFGRWNNRGIYDRNYSETRVPDVPSAIIETASHQNFPDMRLLQDPTVKFTYARSLYKTILKFMTTQHGEKYVVQPLPPQRFAVSVDDDGYANLSWAATTDDLEPTAEPTGYIIYTALGDGDFDNGTTVSRHTNARIKMLPGVVHSFKVAAINKGGESFATEVLCAEYNPHAKRNILIVNGFTRLASPFATTKGFDMTRDMGLTLGATIGWEGMGIVAGNTRNYVYTHAKAIHKAGHYTFGSCSVDALIHGDTSLNGAHIADILLGDQYDDGYSINRTRVLTPAMQTLIADYAQRGGRLMVSGAHIGSDMIMHKDSIFAADILKYSYGGKTETHNDSISGLSLEFTFYNNVNPNHYCVLHPDIIRPQGSAFAAMRYADDSEASVAYDGNDYKSIVMAIPFECITEEHVRNSIMKGIIGFLEK